MSIHVSALTATLPPTTAMAAYIVRNAPALALWITDLWSVSHHNPGVAGASTGEPHGFQVGQ